MSIIFILGPTASGKSDYAFQLARSLEVDIISADAYQVYRGMSIGTAKPSKDMLQNVKHHLIDVVNPDEFFDVARFIKEANFYIDEAIDNKKKILVTGGTNYYIHSLIHGIAKLPERDPSVQSFWKKKSEEQGARWLWDQLSLVDPETSNRLHMNDQRRILRALEVYHVSRTPLSSFPLEGGVKDKYPYKKIALFHPPDLLRKRIESRTLQMMEEGLLEEVQLLIKQGYGECPAVRNAVGYKETLAFLSNKSTSQVWFDQIFQNTKKVVKKQMTWLKREVDIEWLDMTPK